MSISISYFSPFHWDTLATKGTLTILGGTISHKNLQGDLTPLMMAFERALESDPTNKSIQCRMEEAWDSGTHTGDRNSYWEERILELKNTVTILNAQTTRARNQELFTNGLHIPRMKQNVLDLIHSYKLNMDAMIASPFETPEDPNQHEAERKLIKNTLTDKQSLYRFESCVSKLDIEQALKMLKTFASFEERKLAIRYLHAEEKRTLPQEIVDNYTLSTVFLAASPFETPEDPKKHAAERKLIETALANNQILIKIENHLNAFQLQDVYSCLESIPTLNGQKLAVRYLSKEQKETLKRARTPYELTKETLLEEPFKTVDFSNHQNERNFIKLNIDKELLSKFEGFIIHRKLDLALIALETFIKVEDRKLAIRFLIESHKKRLPREQVDPLLTTNHQAPETRNASLFEKYYHYEITQEGLIKVRLDEFCYPQIIDHTHLSGNLDLILEKYRAKVSHSKGNEALMCLKCMIEVWDTRADNTSMKDWERVIVELQQKTLKKANKAHRLLTKDLKGRNLLDLTMKRSLYPIISDYNLTRARLVETFLKKAEGSDFTFEEKELTAERKFIRNSGINKSSLYAFTNICELLKRSLRNASRLNSDSIAQKLGSSVENVQKALELFSTPEERKLAIRYLNAEEAKALKAPRVWEKIKDLISSE